MLRQRERGFKTERGLKRERERERGFKRELERDGYEIK